MKDLAKIYKSFEFFVSKEKDVWCAFAKLAPIETLVCASSKEEAIRLSSIEMEKIIEKLLNEQCRVIEDER